MQVNENPQLLSDGFSLHRKEMLPLEESGAPGLAYLSPESGFNVITGMTKVMVYSLNWYGCPYDKDLDTSACMYRPPPGCDCVVNVNCYGYCAGVALSNFVMPANNYYALPGN